MTGGDSIKGTIAVLYFFGAFLLFVCILVSGGVYLLYSSRMGANADQFLLGQLKGTIQTAACFGIVLLLLLLQIRKLLKLLGAGLAGGGLGQRGKGDKGMGRVVPPQNPV